MDKITTSGANTADKQGERKINSAGIWIFLGALAVFLMIFLIFMGGFFSASKSTGGGSPNTPSNSSTANP